MDAGASAPPAPNAAGSPIPQRGPVLVVGCGVVGASAAAGWSAAGLEVLRPEPTRGAGGCWVQFVHPKSAGGVLLELAEEDR